MALSHSCRLHVEPADIIHVATDMSVLIADARAGVAARETGALQVVCSDPQVANRLAAAFVQLADNLDSRKVDT